MGTFLPGLYGLIHPRIGEICLIVAPGIPPMMTKPEKPMTASIGNVPTRTNCLPVSVKNDSNNPSNLRLYRLPQVLERIPVSRSAWYAGIKSGRYPHGTNLAPRTTVWRSDHIDQIILTLSPEVGRSQAPLNQVCVCREAITATSKTGARDE